MDSQKRSNIMKYCILGHGRWGKDTLGEIMKDTLSLKCKSSSEFVCEKAVFPILRAKYGYKTSQECFEDRHNPNKSLLRKEWFELITDYNTPDKSRLATQLLRENDMYIGLRNKDEFDACKAKNLFDLVIWVDASKRLPPEDKSSMTVTREDADIIIENNEDLASFIDKANRLCNFIQKVAADSALQELKICNSIQRLVAEPALQ